MKNIKYFLLWLCLIAGFGRVFGQTDTHYKVSGSVSDEAGETMIGVTIYVKNEPGVGVVSDIDGNFTIRVAKNSTLVFSCVGYKIQEKLITQDIEGLKIVMEVDNQQLEDVVVVGQGTQRKVSVVGAVSTISPDELQIPSNSITNMIGGRIPGIITRTMSGEPGSDFSEFWVRGVSTFGANASALVLIDGIEGNLNDIDPSDIESFSVLKDASATAVYGVRGANGVVIVTTKKGSAGKTRINLKSSATLSYSPRMPKYLRAYEYAQLANEAREVRGNTPIYDDIEMEIIKNHLDPDLYPDVNWRDVILKDVTWYNQHYLSVSGGSSTARYFMSTGLMNKSAIFKDEGINKYNTNVNWHKYTFRANVEANLTETTVISLGMDGVITKQTSPGYGNDNSALWKAQSNLTPVTVPVRYSNGLLPAYGTGDNQRSPYVLLNYTGYKTSHNIDYKVNFGLNQDLKWITNGLKVNALFSFNSSGSHLVTRQKSPNLYRATTRYKDGSLATRRTVNEQALTYSKSASQSRQYYFESRLNYERGFGDHNVTGLVHYYMQDYQDTQANNETDAIPKRYQALSGRATYSWKDTYLLELNIGYTGSENFKKGHQFGLFPAVAIGWVPTQYEWVQKHLPFVDFFKLRASYGEVGNDRIGGRRFPYITYVSTENVSGRWGNNALQEGQMGADGLEWETAKKYNLGFDGHLFNEHFNFTIDFFKDVRDGIFQQRELLPQELGAVNKPYVNIGSMNSKGIDGSVEYTQNIKQVRLTGRANFTYTTNKVKHWEEAIKKYPYLENSGYSVNVTRGLIAQGLYRDSTDILSGPIPYANVRPGDIKYKDVNGDGRIDNDDMVPIAYSSVPLIMYGFAVEASYKNWTLGIFFRGVGKTNYFLGGNAYHPFISEEQGNVLTQVYNRKNRWIPAWYSGDPSTENPNARYPRLSYGNNTNNQVNSTFWLANGRYLKLQNIDLSYRWQNKAFRKIGLNDIIFQFIGTNLACWDKVKLWDPEQASNNGAVYPLQRTFTFQLSVNF